MSDYLDQIPFVYTHPNFEKLTPRAKLLGLLLFIIKTGFGRIHKDSYDQFIGTFAWEMGEYKMAWDELFHHDIIGFMPFTVESKE